MTLTTNSAEAVPAATTPTSGNSAGGPDEALTNINIGAGSTIQTSSVQKAHGTQSYLITPAAGDVDFIGWTGLTPSTTYAARGYVYFTALPNNAAIMQLRSTSGQVATVAINASGKLFLQNSAATTLWTAASALSLNTWYRIELSCQVATTSTGTYNVAYYPLDSGSAVETPFNTTTANAGTANINEFRIGKLSSTYATGFYVDDIAVQDSSLTFLGALGNTPPSVPLGPSAAAGILSATVSWTAPGSNGGSAVTGYTVTSTPGSITATAGSGATSQVVSGLLGGTSYTFTVHATNTVGDGPESIATSPVTVLSAGQVFSPTTDITTAGWTSSDSASPLCNDINEGTRSDTQYISSPANPSSSVYECKFPTVATPADNLGWQIQVASRFRSGTSGSLVVALVVGTTVIASQTMTLTSAFALYTLTLNGTQGAAISNLADIRARFTATSS